MCFKKKKPNFDSSVVTRGDFLARLSEYGIKPLCKDPLDLELKLATKSELDKIAPALVYPAEWYVSHIWDCEDYALQAQLDAGKKGISVRLCLGLTEFGYHGFALSLDTSGKLWLLESNAIFPWAGQWLEPATDKKNLKEGRYLPKKVFI